MDKLLLDFHDAIGPIPFLVIMGIVALILSLKVIPYTTDLMVNSAAGLAGLHLGRQYRTLVINCSTNNPEVATMAIAFLFGKIAGIGTPLGSNFANIYLIFAVALGWVLVTSWIKDRSSFAKLRSLLRQERKLVIWHFSMSFIMFVMACFSFKLLTGQFPIGNGEVEKISPSVTRILLAALLCCIGIAVFVWRDSILRKKRPELCEDIDEDEHDANWTAFMLGTLGLIASCYVINLLFIVATEKYGVTLATFLGPAVFAVLHYFVGALVTSLPEMNVAVSNYRKLTSPDLNTALSSASASNMSNLAIAAAGALVAAFMRAFLS